MKPPHDDPTVVLVSPAGHPDTTLFAEAGPIRLIEGRARLPLSVARLHVRPGWTIEGATLETTNGRNAI